MTDISPIETTDEATFGTPAPTTEATAEAPAPDSGAGENNILAQVAELAKRDASAAGADEDPTDPQEKPAAPKPDPVESRTQAYLERVVREERRLREERAQIQRQQEQYRHDLEAAKEYRELMQLAQSDPAAFAERIKLNSDQLLESWFKQGQEKKQLTADERVDRLERQLQQEREAYAQRIKEQQEAANNAALQQTEANFKNEIRNHAAANVERYELINIYRQENMVWNEVVNYYQAHQQVPDLAIVMDAVENNLRHDIRRLAGTKFLRSLQAELGAPKQAIITPASNINRARQQAPVQSQKKDRSEDDDRNEILAKIRAFQSQRPAH